jgi:hypothetical protein
MRTSPKFALALLLTFAAPLYGACGSDDPDVIPPSPTFDADVVVPTFDAGICDPVAQNCSDGSKCSLDLAQVAGKNVWGASCRAVTGTVAVGEACTRLNEMPAGIGKDTCDKGLFCTFVGDLSGNVMASARICHPLCEQSATCSGNHPACVALTTDFTPTVGVCAETCNILTDDGICQNGSWCEPRANTEGTGIGTCNAAGTAAINAECSATMDCVAGSSCITSTPMDTTMPPTTACRAVCDIPVAPAVAAHPCEASFKCQKLTSGPRDWGVCIPTT